MDKKLTLPTDALDDSRCFLCNNFLSIPPILIISSDGKENKCGRCVLVETTVGMRNKALESTLRHLYLPCTYGCQHVMPWEEIKDHENECQERTLQCPMHYTNCDSFFTVSKLEDHFKNKHLDNIKYGNVLTYDLKDNHSVVLLTSVGEELFFIYLFVFTDFSSFNIFSLQPSQKYTKYQIMISSVGTTTCITYKNYKIRQFEERSHCYRCMRNKCHLDYHPYAKRYNKLDTNRTQSEEINGKAVRELLKSPASLKFTIQLLGEDDIKKAEQQNFLHKCFECSNCCGLMMKPIYLCRSGHSVCDVCKLSLDKCPKCESEIDVRNFALEEMTENVELPCCYEGQGCTYAGYVESLYKHEKSCAYKSEA